MNFIMQKVHGIANQFCFSKRVNDGSEGVKSTKYCKCTVNGKGRGGRGEGRGGRGEGRGGRGA